MSSVEIIVGHRWKEDVRYIHSLRPQRPAESSLNLLELRDIIDIVIDGTNLTASIPEEAIFGLVANLLSALVDFVEGTSHKAIIEFYHEPWELVLIPDGASLRLSLYSIDRRRRVVARDLATDGRAFLDAICKVAEQMLTELFRVSERFSSAQQIRQISQSLARLKRTRRVHFAPRDGGDSQQQARRRLASTSSAGGLTLGYHFDGGDRALRHYQGEHVFDLHALLFDGIVQAEFGSQDLLLCQEYPFLAMASLLDRTRQLFNQLEGHANAPFVLDEDLAHLDFSIKGEGSRWTLRARDPQKEQWHTYSIHPAECLDALVSVAELFIQDLCQTNPSLEVNQRFVDLQEEVEKLRQWHRDLCGNNHYHDRPEDYLRRLGHVEPQPLPSTPEPDFPWPLSSVHTLFPRRRWSLRAERIDFSSLTLTRDSLLVSTSQKLHSIDAQTGQKRWTHDRDDQGPGDGSMAIAGDWLVATDGSDKLMVLDRRTGELESTVTTDESWRELRAAACYGAQRLLVTGRRGGQVLGFDHSTGITKWRHSTGPGKLQSLLFDGPIACAQSSEGVVTALNPQSGEVLWKIRPGGAPDLDLTMHQGRLYTVTHDQLHGGSSLYALYPFTGRTVWQLRLPGFACGPPSFIDSWMLIPIERHGQIKLTAIDLEAVDPRTNWQLDLSSAGVDHPTPVLAATIDGRTHGLVRTDRAELTCFTLSDGQVRWQSMPAAKMLLLHGNLPLFRIREAVVNVSRTVDFRHIETGELLHSFSAVEAPEFGFLAPPSCLLLGEQGPRYEESDRLTAYSMEHFLALVD